MSKTCFTFLFLFISTQFAHAIAIPPAAIDEQQVQPSCITVRPFYIFGQKQVYGTDGKGPAVRIENKCEKEVTVELVQTGANAQPLKPVPRIDVRLIHDMAKEKNGVDFIFVPKGEDCTEVRGLQETARAAQEQKYFERKGELQQAETPEQMLDILAKSDVAHPDPRFVTCEGADIPVRGALVLGMPWETTYEITGTPDVKISGQMINPLDVNSPETFQFAENGDKVARFVIAVHNIETGQNLKLAMRWLMEAAEQGFRPAILQLQLCYETGKCGVAKDAKEALFWHALGRGDIEPDGELYKRLEEWQKTHPEVTDY